MPPITRALNALPTPVAGAIAHRIWRGLGTPESVHERDLEVHARAQRGQLEVNGSSVVTYRWGAGPRVILLVHGWRSRASRLSAIVRALEPHATVVAFDAPGHGDSGGRFATVLDYAEAIHQLGERHGEFHAIVGHSFGVLSAFLAVREGVATRRIVGISGMHDAETGIMHAFASQLGLSPRVSARLRHLVEARTFAVVDDPWERFTTRIDDPRVPLLLVHDDLDRTVLPVAADLIAAAHPGAVEVLRTKGLGHARILSDPAVLDAIEAFVLAPIPSRVARVGAAD
jgi:pimeloyl-ACP methyl ester carboxylesterase